MHNYLFGFRFVFTKNLIYSVYTRVDKVFVHQEVVQTDSVTVVDGFIFSIVISLLVWPHTNEKVVYDQDFHNIARRLFMFCDTSVHPTEDAVHSL